MKVNGWQRIGIVASIAWILSAGLYTHGSVMASYASMGALFEKTCEQAHPNSNWDQCLKKLTDEIEVGDTIGWEDAALAGLIPIPLGWGLAYLVLFIVRWIKRGWG